MDSTIEKVLVKLFRCPYCKKTLIYKKNCEKLECTSCVRVFPIKGGIPRFVNNQDYTDRFGYQWNRFNKLQLDSYNGTNFSRDRFFKITGWRSEELKDKIVLDAGCGSGRFTEIALQCGAKVVSMDLSNAVEVCYDNLSCDSLLVCQSSIYQMPFEKEIFDYVFCIGVLQHTPDIPEAIKSLSKYVKRGGHISLWIYEIDWKSFLGTTGFKYLFRPITTKISLSAQLMFCELLVKMFQPYAKLLRTKGLLGRIIMRLLPVASAHLQNVLLSNDHFLSWVFLDTFDMYTPKYDRPQRYSKIKRILKELGFSNIKRNQHGGISISAIKGNQL